MSTPARAAVSAAASAQPQSTVPLRDFVTALSRLLDQQPTEAEILSRAGALLGALVARDDWLPAEYAQPHPEHFQQFLLHADSGERFSIVSFVWGPGQRTPIHDHTTWGLIGMLRGAEYSQPFKLDAQGKPQPDGPAIRLEPGAVERVSPRIGDIHRVHNAFDDRTDLAPKIQVNYAARLPWVETIFEQPVLEDPDFYARQESIISFQHPDHETEQWHPSGAFR